MASKKLMREPGNVRGLVPSAEFGIQDKVYGEYLDQLDPLNKVEVQYALAASPDPRFREFLERLSDRSIGNNTKSLQAIAKACDIPLAEFNSWWQKASTQRAIAIAQTKSVELMGDMAEDARSKVENCPRCDGLGFVNAEAGLPPETVGYRVLRTVIIKVYDDDGKGRDVDQDMWIRTCPNNCDKGRLRKPGDEFSRDKILEIGGLISKKGAGINITQNFGGSGMSSAVGRLNDSMTIDID